MTRVSDVLAYLNSVAPPSKMESWDNGGLLCGRKDKAVRKILVALDPFEEVAKEAAQIGADLIVTHHPLIFHRLASVTADDFVSRTVMTLIQNDISAINLHTNLDVAPNGVNDVLANTLGLKNIEVIDPIETDSEGNVWGLLRCGDVPEQTLSAFLAHVQQVLHTPALRYADGGHTVKRVACGGGACAGEFRLAAEAGCDAFVTADARYNDFWDAQALGVSLIDAGHFYTENPVCGFLRSILANAFPDIEVVISAVHKDCMQFFNVSC